ncbi:hypothetical protein [Nitrobacter sp.]|uniref:hypothetical protein n=1 Tax=Nitrobacter sp. TaxID=29420 RepID=UPI003F650BCE
MTLSEVYAPTVNESETITDAKRVRSTLAVPDRGNAQQQGQRKLSASSSIGPWVDRNFFSFSQGARQGNF